MSELHGRVRERLRTQIVESGGSPAFDDPALFADVMQTSTLSETQYNYACFLAAEGRAPEAREWAERILRKKATMPDYIRRRERPWFRKAGALLTRLPRNAPRS